MGEHCSYIQTPVNQIAAVSPDVLSSLATIKFLSCYHSFLLHWSYVISVYMLLCTNYYFSILLWFTQYVILVTISIFSTASLFTLGAYFLLSDTEQIHKCTLNSDHHKLIITSHESINLSSVMEIKSNNTEGKIDRQKNMMYIDFLFLFTIYLIHKFL